MFTLHPFGRPVGPWAGHVGRPLCLAVLVAAAAAQTAVSPSDRAGLEGSSFTHFPLGRFNCRMQQLHGDLPPGTTLSGHAYRRDAIAIHGHVDAFVSDLQVSVSMSPNDPAHASTTFANNVGPNPVLVLPRIVLGFPATDRPGLDPTPTFDLQIPYQVPFLVPSTGGTVCVDTVIYSNTSAAGIDHNMSLYLDCHQLYADGRNEQPGMRLGGGCATAGATATAYTTFTLWHLGASMALDVAARNGVPDVGGNSRAFVMLGTGPANVVWPPRPACSLLTTTNVWFVLPGTNNAAGDCDGTLSGLPVLPANYRLWLQSGSIDLATGSFVVGDQSTLRLPPAGPTTLPSARIVNSTDNAAATGTVSLAVPVVQFS
jgi:hypothetical protein